ncbi:hypothetical protein TW84_21575 [Vibrio neptunius]|nr:hypothetical protein TW84_21575 [Vibrio neptunius]
MLPSRLTLPLYKILIFNQLISLRAETVDSSEPHIQNNRWFPLSDSQRDGIVKTLQQQQGLISR